MNISFPTTPSDLFLLEADDEFSILFSTLSRRRQFGSQSDISQGLVEVVLIYTIRDYLDVAGGQGLA